MTQIPPNSTGALWARFRFSVVGSLLSCPPAPGTLKTAIRSLAAKTWSHPTSRRDVQFAAATIARWYYTARRGHDDPVGALRRAVRKDRGKISLAAPLAERLILQHHDHPDWSYQLHYDNLAASAKAEPELGQLPSYATIKRYMQAHGLVKKPGFPSHLRPGQARAQQRREDREVRSYEATHVGALWHLDFHHGSLNVLTHDGNGKQEAFWGRLEGRLMKMLEGVPELTLALLNQTTQAWVEIEYNRAEHRETACSPVERFAHAPDVLRDSPSSESLRDTFRLETTRRQRHSDGTISLEGVRFEVPARYQLWGARSVGVIGGAPKCAKTWLGLDMALSVATGTACLGRYAVPEPGPVLVYLAEDALPVVRERIDGMARHRGLDLAGVEVHVITAAVLRLDRGPDRTRLWETTRRLRPRLLVLDPLVRLHGIDENHAGEVAELLAYFRSLQRKLDLAVLLVHHTRKNATGGVAAGQGLRGSGDIHAFGDSNLYLRRNREHLVLSSEHRAAPASAPVNLELVTTNTHTHLEVVSELAGGPTKLGVDGRQRGLEERVLDLLGQGATLTRAKLRDLLGVKNERLGEALESLERAGRLGRTPGGWQRLDCDR